MLKMVFLAALLGGFPLIQSAAYAGEADVERVEIRKQSNGTYSFDVTVRHADTGWDHYADGWEVVAPDGTVLGVRTLYHPHVNEQPFTRSLSGVQIPEGVDSVIVRAQDSEHGFGGVEKMVEVPR
ncbi:MAG: hypothetical protein AAF220_14925, partial [Pseudomonadota bacterium]